MTDHDEREIEEMEERAERLEGEIDDAREDWERKKDDPSIPGARPDEEDTGGPQPETNYPSKGDEEDL